MITAETIFQHIQQLREQSPTVHSITNLVVMQTTANVLLAAGASPIMAHALTELKEISSIVNSLNINIGTLDEEWVKSIKYAQQLALKHHTPIIFDPVGSGATHYRTKTAREILQRGITVIRGNSSEIMSLVNEKIKTKGVDSLHEATEAKQAAKQLAKQYDCIVVISGKIDIIIDNTTEVLIEHGSPLFTKVTGMGCALTALIAAFASINKNYLQATIAAIIMFTIAGEKAAKTATGPGSFYPALLDSLNNLQSDDLQQLNIEVVNTNVETIS